MPARPTKSPGRTAKRLLALALAAVLVPYACSRLASRGRRVSVHSSDGGGDPIALSSSRPLRIACYNIAHGRGTAESNWAGGSGAAKTKRLDDIATKLRDINADVVVLNEVDFDCSWSHGVNQAEYLADQAGYPYWAEQRNLDFRILLWTWKFGNAVLSKQPIQRAKSVDFPAYSSWESLLCGQKRGLRCELGSTRRIQLFAIHLSHRSESVRVDSVDRMTELMQNSSQPVVVAGDFNSTPPGYPGSTNDERGNNALARMRNRLQAIPTRAPENPQDFTFHSERPQHIIDWIFVPQDAVVIDDRIDSANLSDHRAVVAEVQLNFP